MHGPPVTHAEVEAQIKTLAHRGPDESGVFISPSAMCGLGIRRLSIIDVAGGRQPLHNEDRTVHLVYNGETYNHRHLRTELVQLGHRPGSHSDAEVVLHGYEAWGAAEMLRRLRGMAAFALWDNTQRRLVLARDRFGIKPLYYAKHNGRLYFASEIKAILTQPNFPRQVNLQALQAMLTVGFVPGPVTAFAGIYQLPPAHFLTAQNGRFKIKPYWSLEYRPDDTISEADAVEHFRVLLQEAVNIRLMSEVPLGALLSGGLDSGTLVALVQAGLDQPVKTVSIGFEVAAYDEARRAAELARFIGTEHHTLHFAATGFDDYPQIVRHLEAPQCSATAAPIYRLYQACRAAGLTVVLTGEGADELLGGYHWHRGDVLARPLLKLPLWLRRAVAALPGGMSAAARRVLVRGHRSAAQRYLDWLEVPGAGHRATLFSSDAAATLNTSNANNPLAGWGDNLDQAALDPFHQLLWLEMKTRLVDFINLEVDKMGMAHSVEARVPFLDHKLWEFCATLPAGYKLHRRTEKHLLRQATRGVLPESTRTRRKKGLAAPFTRWLQSERLPAWAEEMLTPKMVQATGLFDAKQVQQLRRQVQLGEAQLGSLLMGVLTTQLWYEEFIK